MRILLFIAAVFMFACCNRTSLLPDEYVKWMEDPANGARIAKGNNGCTFEVQYKTKEYCALKENGGNINALDTSVSDILRYFTFRIYNNSPKSLFEQSVLSQDETIAYLSYDLSNDLYLLTETDTLRPLLYHWVRTYNLSNHYDILLAFGPRQGNTDEILVYNDRLFGTGKNDFAFSNHFSESLPELKIL